MRMPKTSAIATTEPNFIEPLARSSAWTPERETPVKSARRTIGACQDIYAWSFMLKVFWQWRDAREAPTPDRQATLKSATTSASTFEKRFIVAKPLPM